MATAALRHDPAHPRHLSVAHLRENIAATNIKLTADAVDELDRIGAR